MNRRKFLKLFGVGCAAVAVAPALLAEKGRTVVFRRYDRLPLATTPLVEGEVFGGRTYASGSDRSLRYVEYSEHAVDQVRAGAGRTGKHDFMMNENLNRMMELAEISLKDPKAFGRVVQL